MGRHIMKKVLVLEGILLSSLVLAACTTSNNHTNSSSSTSIKKQLKSSKKAKSSVSKTTPSANTLWNTKKDRQLAQFIAAWGPSMNQIYKEYTPDNNVNYYGVRYPNELVKNTTVVDGTPVSIEYSKNGKGNKDYEVVAVYSDAENQETMNAHLYLFAIRNNQPVALVTMQNQGAEDGKYHFSETKNSDVSKNFSSIFNNQGTSFKKNSTTTTSNKLDPDHVAATLLVEWHNNVDGSDVSAEYYADSTGGEFGDGVLPSTSKYYIVGNMVKITTYAGKFSQQIPFSEVEKYYEEHKETVDHQLSLMTKTQKED